MVWRPQLVARRGKGGISSPTSSGGYVLWGTIGGVFACGSIAAAFAGKPLLLIVLPISALLLRDAWAWFAASSEERRAFRRTIDQGGGPDQVQMAADPAALVAIALWLVGSIGAVVLWPRSPALISLLFAAAFTVVAILDLVRAAIRRSDAR
jgi:hypothetical protein